MNRIFRLLSLFAFLSVLTASAVAQVATAELHVTVKDPKGATIGNATIVVRNEASSLERTQRANVEGEYQFRALPPGRYAVTVEAPGFAKAVAKDLTVTVGQIAELPVTLQIAGATEVVNVSSEAELIETQRTTTATTIEQARIENLPINGRNYINFALTNSQLARDTAPSIGAAPTSGLNVGGQRARNNIVNVDGMDAVDNSTNGIRSTVSQEAVQEFQLLTNGYTAEYGRASGGVVNIITRGGGNDFHGSAFGYLRNRKLQAVNPFSTLSDPAYTRVQAGFTVGGAIKKDRTFYFLSSEFTRRRESGYSSIGQNNFGMTNFNTGALTCVWAGAPTGGPCPWGTIPLTGDQITRLTALKQQSDALAAGNPVLAGQIRGATFNYLALAARSGGMAMQGAWFGPAALGGGYSHFPTICSTPPCAPVPGLSNFVTLNSLIGNFPVTEETDIYSLRLDHRLTNNHQLLLRGSVSPSAADGIQVQAQGPQNFGQNAQSRTSRQDYHDWSITAQETWTIGTNKVNEFRYQFSRRGLLYSYADTPDGGKVAVNIPGVAFFGREPFSFVNRIEKRHQFTDNFSWTKGTHSVKFGGDINYLPLQADFTVNFGGIYNFGDLSATSFGFPAGLNFPAFNPVQAYGLGIPQNFIQGVGNPHDEFTNTAMGFFVQDSWRINPRLTLNYGLRYDVELTPTFKATTALADASQAALGITQGIPRDYNNFAPRVGLAWDPWGDNKTVIRASYGMFYDHPLLALAFNSDVADASQAPQIVLLGGTPGGCTLNASNAFLGILGCMGPQFNFLGNEQRFNPAPNAPSIWRDQQFLGAAPLTFLPFGFPTATNFVYPYSTQASLSIEHDLGRNLAFGLAYNFNGGRHLNRPINSNAVRADLLYENWQRAIAAANAAGIPTSSPNYPSDPRFVAICPAALGGLAPAGNFAPAAMLNFFRRSGLNPSLAGGPCLNNALALQSEFQIGFSGITPGVPFSDMPANYSNGSSVYHGMTATLRKRFSNHYEFLASYTWSHAIDDSTDLQSPLSPQDNYRPDLERSNSLFDQRHRFVLSSVYQSGRVGSGLKSAILSDWTIAPIVDVASGRPFNIISGSDTNFDFGTTTDRPMMAVAGQTSSCTPQGAVASKYSPTGYLIPACFADGQINGGNLPRNFGRKPMTVFTDLRVSRRISITERIKLDAIADMFNVLNRNNTADVNPLWNLAGQPTAAFDPRQVQLALRLSW